jgi:2-oxoglutarate ferredoxin oxidoreductase subunit alpha
LPIIAASSPKDCFDIAIEAVRIATKYMTPVVVLSDGYIATGSEPWRLPQVGNLPDLQIAFRTDPEGFKAYQRDPETLARPWAIPGTAGLEHRIGGIEKADGTGNISYDPDNHDLMVRTRAAKIAGIDVPDLEVDDLDDDTRVLVLGWGSTYGPIAAAVRRIRRSGGKVAQVHLRHLNPLPANTGEVLKRYDKVLLPEINLGQLAMLLRARFLVDVISYNRVRGLPFKAEELAGVIQDVIDSE